MTNFAISGTGHRPNKIFYKNKNCYDTQTKAKLQCFLIEALKWIQPEEVISGMALGYDTSLALAALDLKIPLICALPFTGQEKIWPQESQKTYHEILDMADVIEIISQGGYSPAKMQVRNEWMVKHSGLTIALWNGTNGGTKNCIDYIDSLQKPYINYWDKWTKYVQTSEQISVR